MATQKPRITITLDPKVYAALRSFSEGAGVPMSAFVSQTLTQSLPLLERLAAVMQAARRAQPEALKEIGLQTQKLVGVAEFIHSQLGQGVDMFWGKDLAALDPPPPNRGGQNSDRGGQKPSKVTRIRDHRRAR